ncbi:YveK family protein [Thalassobacillus hwangdonensis]|uniref:YveK family protein n=1 Tax=Thalassobacillus hwangdonensis TaxID=546108 RepID=A0ABW3L2F6_9BACI
MNKTMSFRDVFLVLKKRALLILSTIIAAVVAAAVLSYFILQPSYQATSQFIVNTDSNQRITDFNVNDIRTNVELINTYNVVIKSPAILDKAIEQMGLDISAEELSSKLNVSNAEDSQVVEVTATDGDQASAAEIANTTVQIFKQEIPTLMSVDNVNILSTAQVKEDPVPVSPQPFLNMAMAVVIGIMVGIALAFFKEYWDLSIKNELELEQKVQVPIMGVISHISEEEVLDMIDKRPKRAAKKSKGGRLYGNKTKKIG